MDAFVYFYDDFAAGLDEIEEALDEALDGVGGVTGGGTGVMGSNIDLALDDGFNEAEAVLLIKSVLRRFNVPPSSRIVVASNEHRVTD